MFSRAVTVAVFAGMTNCGSGQPGAALPTVEAEPSPAERPPIDSGAARTRALEIKITPLPAKRIFEFEVESRLGSGNARWEMPLGARGLSELSFRDEAGEIRHTLATGFAVRLDAQRAIASAGVRAVLARAPEGSVTARYRVAAQTFAADRPLAPSMDPNQALLSGESALLLPEGARATPVPVRLSVDPKAFGRKAGVASTIGLGPTVTAELSNTALWASTVLVGQVGVARFAAPEGLDRAGWLGYSSFDPRQVAAEVAGFRSGARQYFGARAAAPSTLLLFSDARKPGQFDARRRAGGVLVQVGLMQRWDGPLRIAVMQQLMREWIGAELSIAAADANFPLERAWFLDGFNRTLTRELLFRFGLLTPEEFRDDVQQMVRLYVTSPLKDKPLHALKRDRHDDAAAIIVARGSLYALVIDGAIRKTSSGKRSLDNVVKELYARWKKKRAPLSPKTFVAVVQSQLGDDALKLDSGVLRGDTPPQVPAAAMGPCFVSVKRRYEIYDLGFVPSKDEEGTTTAVQVTPKGSAARAGLREGDLVKLLRHAPGELERKVVLEVQRDDKTVRLNYRPSGGFAWGQGFDRKPQPPDAACNKRR